MTVLPLSFQLVQRLLAALAVWSRQRRDRIELECMSESELRDIGIGRSQIPGLID